MLNTQFSVARAIALETGRPAGVWLEGEGLSATPPAVVYASRAFIAETPSPYAGDIVGATMNVNPTTRTAVENQGAVLTNLVAINDEVRFDYKGPSYTITNVVNSTITFATKQTCDPLPPSGALPYQILRQPKKSSAPPLELPKGTVVDLMSSGYGASVTPPDAATKWAYATKYLCILFAANGEVSKVLTVSRDTTKLLNIESPTQTMHLLVGSIEKCSTAAPDENLQDNSNLWVSIAPQTGRVTTAENAWTAGGTIADARQFAQSSQAKGGR
jgi:hypothetical protein